MSDSPDALKKDSASETSDFGAVFDFNSAPAAIDSGSSFDVYSPPGVPLGANDSTISPFSGSPIPLFSTPVFDFGGPTPSASASASAADSSSSVSSAPSQPSDDKSTPLSLFEDLAPIVPNADVTLVDVSTGGSRRQSNRRRPRGPRRLRQNDETNDAASSVPFCADNVPEFENTAELREENAPSPSGSEQNTDWGHRDSVAETRPKATEERKEEKDCLMFRWPKTDEIESESAITESSHSLEREEQFTQWFDESRNGGDAVNGGEGFYCRLMDGPGVDSLRLVYFGDELVRNMPSFNDIPEEEFDYLTHRCPLQSVRLLPREKCIDDTEIREMGKCFGDSMEESSGESSPPVPTELFFVPRFGCIVSLLSIERIPVRVFTLTNGGFLCEGDSFERTQLEWRCVDSQRLGGVCCFSGLWWRPRPVSIGGVAGLYDSGERTGGNSMISPWWKVAQTQTVAMQWEVPCRTKHPGLVVSKRIRLVRMKNWGKYDLVRFELAGPDWSVPTSSSSLSLVLYCGVPIVGAIPAFTAMSSFRHSPRFPYSVCRIHTHHSRAQDLMIVNGHFLPEDVVDVEEYERIGALVSLSPFASGADQHMRNLGKVVKHLAIGPRCYEHGQSSLFDFCDELSSLISILLFAVGNGGPECILSKLSFDVLFYEIFPYLDELDVFLAAHPEAEFCRTFLDRQHERRPVIAGQEAAKRRKCFQVLGGGCLPTGIDGESDYLHHCRDLALSRSCQSYLQYTPLAVAEMAVGSLRSVVGEFELVVTGRRRLWCREVCAQLVLAIRAICGITATNGEDWIECADSNVLWKLISDNAPLLVRAVALVSSPCDVLDILLKVGPSSDDGNMIEAIICSLFVNLPQHLTEGRMCLHSSIINEQSGFDTVLFKLVRLLRAFPDKYVSEKAVESLLTFLDFVTSVDFQRQIRILLRVNANEEKTHSPLMELVADVTAEILERFSTPNVLLRRPSLLRFLMCLGLSATGPTTTGYGVVLDRMLRKREKILRSCVNCATLEEVRCVMSPPSLAGVSVAKTVSLSLLNSVRESTGFWASIMNDFGLDYVLCCRESILEIQVMGICHPLTALTELFVVFCAMAKQIPQLCWDFVAFDDRTVFVSVENGQDWGVADSSGPSVVGHLDVVSLVECLASIGAFMRCLDRDWSPIAKKFIECAEELSVENGPSFEDYRRNVEDLADVPCVPLQIFYQMVVLGRFLRSKRPGNAEFACSELLADPYALELISKNRITRRRMAKHGCPFVRWTYCLANDIVRMQDEQPLIANAILRGLTVREQTLGLSGFYQWSDCSESHLIGLFQGCDKSALLRSDCELLLRHLVFSDDSRSVLIANSDSVLQICSIILRLAEADETIEDPFSDVPFDVWTRLMDADDVGVVSDAISLLTKIVSASKSSKPSPFIGLSLFLDVFHRRSERIASQGVAVVPFSHGQLDEEFSVVSQLVRLVQAMAERWPFDFFVDAEKGRHLLEAVVAAFVTDDEVSPASIDCSWTAVTEFVLLFRDHREVLSGGLLNAVIQSLMDTLLQVVVVVETEDSQRNDELRMRLKEVLEVISMDGRFELWKRASQLTLCSGVEITSASAIREMVKGIFGEMRVDLDAFSRQQKEELVMAEQEEDGEDELK